MFIYKINKYYKENDVLENYIIPKIILQQSKSIKICKEDIDINNIYEIWNKQKYILFHLCYAENMKIYYILLDKEIEQTDKYRKLCQELNVEDHHCDFYAKKYLYTIKYNLDNHICNMNNIIII